MGMFCRQCQETARNQGCTIQGVCGKTEETAGLQDVLIHALKGLSFWAVKAREAGVAKPEADLFVAEALFTTLTNVNFDPSRILGLINRALELRDSVRQSVEAVKPTCPCQESSWPDGATWKPAGEADIRAKVPSVSLQNQEAEDIRSLKELLLYGLKGVAAYADHAYVLDAENAAVLAFLEEGLVAIARPDIGADELVGLVMQCGKTAVDAMALLDGANTGRYGKPEITAVSTGFRPGPAILISGHDLRDLEELLIQTEGTGVNIYTHGEMLPANAYPGLKKHSHLAGNYGTSWFNQAKEFAAFNGAVLMTTNCLVKPQDSYKDRLFTTGLVGWPGVAHIGPRTADKPKDFAPVIEKAKQLGGLTAQEGGQLTIGFAKDQVMALADKVIAAVKSGAIKRFVVMAGCDGRHKERAYYEEVAKALPKDHVILTAGCAKYRYNGLDLGDIGGIPRVLDAGQCNDSYSLAYIALQLKAAFGLDDINALPISYDIAWYEQKAVCVLLALLYLGVKGIRLGPTLPAFLSPNVAKVLVEKFDIKPIGTVADDVAAIGAGH